MAARKAAASRRTPKAPHARPLVRHLNRRRLRRRAVCIVPALAASPHAQLLVLARKAATVQSLDPALVCAVVEQESAWNPWAMRYEPAFFSKYVASLYTNNKIAATEAYSRGFSWGLMQVMGQVAREAGFDALFLSALCDPEQGLAVG